MESRIEFCQTYMTFIRVLVVWKEEGKISFFPPMSLFRSKYFRGFCLEFNRMDVQHV